MKKKTTFRSSSLTPMPKKCLLTLTLWTWMVFPQSSRYCFRSLSCNTIKHHYHLWVYSFEYFWVCVCVWVCVTRYSKTSVRDFCVWMMSWSVTILACFRSFSRDTEKKKRDVNVLLTYNQQWLLFNWVFFFYCKYKWCSPRWKWTTKTKRTNN